MTFEVFAGGAGGFFSADDNQKVPQKVLLSGVLSAKSATFGGTFCDQKVPGIPPESPKQPNFGWVVGGHGGELGEGESWGSVWVPWG